MCYIIPTAAAVVTTFIKKKTEKLYWLNLMFYGGAVFGFVDHLWNGELFLVSPDWVKDVLLGVVITVATVVVWAFILLFSKKKIKAAESSI
ncbi:MAG: hypothetical protein NZ928_07745 [Endomicrobia bacterium]|nr:hypothetical protein [Endomicrobiia bacterium]MDW8056322.1 hypothetical protein [Elusimicrobiota bacterium]